MTHRRALAFAVSLYSLGHPRPAAGTFCMSHVRGSVLPVPCSEGASPRASVVFVAGGSYGAAIANAIITGKYRHWRYHFIREGKRDVEVPHRARMVGNLVLVEPREPLTPMTWHRLVVTPRNTVVTRFKTGRASSSKEPPGPPRVVEVRQEPRVSGLSGHSHRVSLRLAPLEIGVEDAPLFHLEVEHKRGGAWHPLQGFPLYESLGSPAVYRALTTLQTGSAFCGPGPVMPGGTQQVRVALVRSDGRRWLSGVQTIRVDDRPRQHDRRRHTKALMSTDVPWKPWKPGDLRLPDHMIPKDPGRQGTALSKEQIAAGMEGVRSCVSACGRLGGSGTCDVQAWIDSRGRVSRVKVPDDVGPPPFRKCVAAGVREARFPPGAKPVRVKHRYTTVLP